MDTLTLTKATDAFSGKVILPTSKSISNRLLIMEAIAGESFGIHGMSEAEDTQRLLKLLRHIKVCGVSDIPLIVDTGNAGTVMRFLLALLAFDSQRGLLTGCERMRNRPIAPLVEGLRALGAHIEYAEHAQYPPLRIQYAELSGGTIEVDASQSSQFVSALMLIAPYLEGGLQIRFKGKLVSRSYIEMTARLMEQMDASVSLSDEQIIIQEGSYAAASYEVEGDWSSASYWYQMVSLSKNGEVFLEGLQQDSLQGDSVLPDIFEKLGVTSKFEKGGLSLKKSFTMAETFNYDFSSCPDIAPSVIVSCAAHRIKAEFTGIDHLKYKESDRIASLQEALKPLGVVFKEDGEKLSLEYASSKRSAEPIVFHSRGDHRMAMSLAALVLVYNQVQIKEPKVVQKSYPGFWEDMKRLGIVN